MEGRDRMAGMGTGIRRFADARKTVAGGSGSGIPEPPTPTTPTTPTATATLQSTPRSLQKPPFVRPPPTPIPGVSSRRRAATLTAAQEEKLRAARVNTRQSGGGVGVGSPGDKEPLSPRAQPSRINVLSSPKAKASNANPYFPLSPTNLISSAGGGAVTAKTPGANAAASSPALARLRSLHRRHASAAAPATAPGTPASHQTQPSTPTTTTATSITTTTTANSTPTSTNSSEEPQRASRSTVPRPPLRPAQQQQQQQALTPPTETSSPTSSLSPRRRSPARFSSNGVATSTGPPPSLAYKKISEIRGQHTATPIPPVPQVPQLPQFEIEGGVKLPSFPTNAADNAQGLERKEKERKNDGAAKMNNYRYDDDDSDTDKDRTIRGLEDLRNSRYCQPPPPAPDSADDQGEDVFLNLAGGRERRRTRLSQYSQRRDSIPDHGAGRSESEHEPSSSPPDVGDEVWRQSRIPSPVGYHTRRVSTATDRSTEERSMTTPRPSVGGRTITMLRRGNSPGGHGRSHSMAEPARPSTANLASLTGASRLRAAPRIDDSRSMAADLDFSPGLPQLTRSRTGGASSAGQEDSASSVSTTAQSSVWDELDDLKSRIRRLEVTGRMPASGAGNGSNSSGDRPRTATTTVTTVDSSPRHPGYSPANSTYGSGPSPYPLLNTALGKARQMVSPEVYKHLELASNDALLLAGMVGPPGSAAPASVATDRQVRRKVDSMCRSLTELCIALSEQRPSLTGGVGVKGIQASPRSTSRPVSRDRSSARESLLSNVGRESMLGRESAFSDRRSALNRFAERKGSISGLSAAAAFSSPRSSLVNDQASAAIRHRRSAFLESRLDDTEGRDLRAPSRAVTEVQGRRFSKDYQPPTPLSGLPSRRSYTNNVSLSSPTLPPPSSSSRRYFSSAIEREALSDADPDPRNSRLAPAADPEAGVGRYRSGSLSKQQPQPQANRRSRGLRESIEIEPSRLRR